MLNLRIIRKLVLQNKSGDSEDKEDQQNDAPFVLVIHCKRPLQCFGIIVLECNTGPIIVR